MSEKRFINANDIDFRFSCDYANGEIFVNINDVKKAIAMAPTADVVGTITKTICLCPWSLPTETNEALLSHK